MYTRYCPPTFSDQVATTPSPSGGPYSAVGDMLLPETRVASAVLVSDSSQIDTTKLGPSRWATASL